MILLRLFIVFSYIGLFNFGGGYAMLSFIQQEVVQNRGWLSESEFTDIVAISQTTPGPIGINCATYTGYTAVTNDAQMAHLSQQLLPQKPRLLLHVFGILGSVLASFSVLWLPFVVMIGVSRLILKYRHTQAMQGIFAALRPAIIGLLASACLALINTANFGQPDLHPLHFGISVATFAVVFAGMRLKKFNLIYTTLACGLLGILLYGIVGL